MKKLLIALVGVWIIVGNGPVHCDNGGCTAPPIYWTGNVGKDYGTSLGWSYNWKDAAQYPYGSEGNLHYVIPNGSHCCYAEDPTRIDSVTGEVLGYGPPDEK